MLKKSFVLTVLLLPVIATAQIAGESVYQFVTMPTSARAAALGGSGMAINDGDISLSRQNPALLNKAMHGAISINHAGFVSDINYGYANYAHHIERIGTFSAGIQYFSGGEFIETDQIGTELGTFGVSEFALNLSYAKSFDSVFTIGASFKPVISQLERYSSFGLLMDIGVEYTTKDKLTTATVVLNNMGAQVSSYADEYADVPFSINAGFSTKLAHAPFRFHVIASNLETPELYGIQTNDADLRNVAAQETDEEEEKIKTADKILTHGVFGVEFLPSKNFVLRGGFNYRRRYELKHTTKPGMIGFSWGVGIKIKKFHLSYANVRYTYSGSGAAHYFGISTNINKFI